MAGWVEWFGVDEFVAALTETVTKADAESRAAVSEAASMLEATAKANASGRPGPNVISGALRGGIRHTPIYPFGVRGWATEVGPTVIYSRRIELGFHGTDSIGRHYNQSGFPYFVPAFVKTAPKMLGVYAAHWSRVISG